MCFSCKSVPTPQEYIAQERYEEAKELFLSKVYINSTDVNQETSLHVAARMGDPDIVYFLLAKGADPYILNGNGDTALHIALKNNKYEVAKILAETGSCIFVKNRQDKTPVDYIIDNPSEYAFEALITKKTGDILDEKGRNIVHYFALANQTDAIAYCGKVGINMSYEDIEDKTPLLMAYENAEELEGVETAVALLRAKCEPARGKYSYFEDAIRTYNLNLRFNENQTPLHIAASRGHIGIAEYLLKYGALNTAQDNTGATPLHEAVKCGRTSIVKLLLANGADVNARDSQSRTPLLIKIPSSSQDELYSILLANKADITAKDYYGDTCLHAATASNVKTSIVTKLVQAGADINARNEEGITPLALAVDKGFTDLIVFYVGLGADIHAEDKEQNTPLTRALKALKDNGDIVLLQKVVNRNNIASRDSQGNTPLHLAIKYGSTMDCINYLLDCGADIDARNSAGVSLLYMVVDMNYKAAGEVLINRGADVYAADASDYSPLRLAMEKGYEVKEWFFCQKVINGCDGNGNTPIHYAAGWTYNDCINYIVKAGGDINKVNAAGETALFNAVRQNAVSTIELLVHLGADLNARDYLLNTPLHIAVREKQIEAASTLIEKGSNINTRNLSGKTPLSLAVIVNDETITALLINANADVNAYDITGKTILMDAVQNKADKTLLLLLQSGANVNAPDMYGRNAYHEAAAIKDINIINTLCSYGGNALSCDSFGKTPFSMLVNDDFSLIKAILGDNTQLIDSNGNNPLHAALSCKAPCTVLQSLIELGYNTNQRNGQGLTPLNLAISLKLKDQSKVLIMCGADPFITDNSGECAVTQSFAKENEEILDNIIATIGNSTDIYGQTVLHYAARSASSRTVQHILDLGLDKTIKDNAGETPYDLAVRWKNTAVQDLLEN